MNVVKKTKDLIGLEPCPWVREEDTSTMYCMANLNHRGPHRNLDGSITWESPEYRTVLDHGYVQFIESMGSDEDIIESARMSTNAGFKGWGPKQCDCVPPGPALPLVEVADINCRICKGTGLMKGDEGLLGRLYRDKHMSPFEMGTIKIEVQAPIFVFREWHRHRTQSYNEMSARYVPLPDVNYIPSIERLMIEPDKKNKQAQGTGGILEKAHAEIFQERLKEEYKAQQSLYEEALKDGVPKELARLVLPVGRYSRMRASANLRNWLGFLTLRMDKDAQYEIRQYANLVGDIVKMLFPRTWELFIEGEK